MGTSGKIPRQDLLLLRPGCTTFKQDWNLAAMNDKFPPLELWLPDIKKYVFESLQKLLIPAGFSFRKSESAFRREHGKDHEEFSILFANQFPINYRLSFLLEIWNHEVKSVKSAFPGHTAIENFKMRSLVLFLNQFKARNTGQEEINQANDFVLYTNKDLFLATDNLVRLIQEQALPLADQLSELDGLDSFFEDRKGWSVNNLNLNNMTTDLIVAKLNGKRNMAMAYEEMLENIDQKIQAREMSEDIKKIIARLYLFLKAKY
jgi:hypothetical protein